MNQVAKGLTKRDRELRKYILKDLTSAKWYLWHGNVFKALELTGLRQISSPNKAQSAFVSKQYVPIVVQPLHKTERHCCPKRL